ncbi:hypothetical protein KFE25_007574 [Diacronema lutheri]|uniref:tRNA(Phe) (4-demethylwyosine(37)-C(7)) aminocarboxypropyltransferase n=1 Tax=Diacronema lutheri TaxID=2081491 RepID=A0A8J6CFF2_DIALT|nr:hypothetical protein KFE25_007574 [Diacronema lutheri]
MGPTALVLLCTARARQARPSAPVAALVRTVDLRQACPHFEACPGCSVARRLDEPPVLERARAFFRAECGVADVPSVCGAATGWRTHAKLAVRGTAESPRIGLFKARSHDVLEIPHCAVQHPAINEGAAELARLMASARTTVYDEASGTGLVRYVQMSVERASATVQLVLVCNAPPPPAARAPSAHAPRSAAPRGLDALLELLAERMAHGATVWHSVWVHFNDERRNNIISYAPSTAGRWRLALGAPTVREVVGARTFEFPPFVFRQANLDAFEAIVRQVADAVPAGAAVAELYAGVGILGLNCVERALSVRCSDVNPHLDAPVAAALALLPPELRARATYTRVDAADAAAAELPGADTLIVDPPRKGLDPALLRELCAPRAAGGAARDVQLLAYVSCGYDALERDARALVGGGGGWVVRSARAHVLFPGADHIETVAVLERR